MPPWGAVRGRALSKLNVDFAKATDRADPNRTVAYFWPNSPVDLIRHAKSLGILTIREMINSACATSREILIHANARLGMRASGLSSADKVASEIKELQLYDFIFASNPEVEASLTSIGIPKENILRTSFGWDPRRFDGSAGMEGVPTPRFIFVGTLGVRKGIPDLLEAWRLAGVDGELVLVGAAESADINRIVQGHTRTGRIRAVGHVDDVGPLLRSADVFVFPTLEEGGPQVTYETAGCSLPIITTKMGAARLVSDGVNGIIVEPGAVRQLADAIRMLASRPDLRIHYGEAARRDSARFTYESVGAQRSGLITDAWRKRHGKAGATGQIGN